MVKPVPRREIVRLKLGCSAGRHGLSDKLLGELEWLRVLVK